MDAVKLCLHCKAEPAGRPRGLGWRCYYVPGVREQYPLTSRFHVRGPGNCEPVGPPDFATTALPGSAAKVEIMRLRAGLGQHLRHPQDARH